MATFLTLPSGTGVLEHTNISEDEKQFLELTAKSAQFATGSKLNNAFEDMLVNYDKHSRDLTYTITESTSEQNETGLLCSFFA